MMQPTVRNFERSMDSEEWQALYCMGGRLHPNPRFYKHYWQIFTPACGWEGKEFFENSPLLCTHDFLVRMRELQAAGKSCMVYGWSRPRRDPRNPFDMNHPRWKDREFAPSWDDDTDPIVEGGHK
jgi:hypothetical protein